MIAALLNPWLLGGVALAIAGAGLVGELHGHGRGVAETRAAWDAEKLEQLEAKAELDRLFNRAAGVREAEKMAQRVRVITATEGLTHELQKVPVWRDEPLPVSVRDALTAAAARAIGAGEPASAVPRADAAELHDERRTSAGLSVRAGWLARMFPAASGAR
jgi:hypothetical protein